MDRAAPRATTIDRAPSMSEQPKTNQQLVAESRDLLERLREAEATLSAIRSGEVDALVVEGEGGLKVFALKDSDRPFRLLIEEMNEGAVTLTGDGSVSYCNRHFADLMECPLERVIGSSIHQFIPRAQAGIFLAMLADGLAGSGRGEVMLKTATGREIPAHLSLNP